MSKDNLGLAKSDYAKLVETATHVMHTQWQVDFNVQLASFEPHIRGVRQLVEFGLDARRRGRQVRLFFTSSVAVANKAQSTTLIPEEKIDRYEMAGSGYGESKLVAETVLLEAGVKAGLDVTVARVGQIAGPVLRSKRGQWNKKEWFPSVSMGLVVRMPLLTTRGSSLTHLRTSGRFHRHSEGTKASTGFLLTFSRRLFLSSHWVAKKAPAGLVSFT
jgi:thioester reductase-like protein